jgi:hypothetical protein
MEGVKLGLYVLADDNSLPYTGNKSHLTNPTSDTFRTPLVTRYLYNQ